MQNLAHLWHHTLIQKLKKLPLPTYCIHVYHNDSLCLTLYLHLILTSNLTFAHFSRFTHTCIYLYHNNIFYYAISVGNSRNHLSSLSLRFASFSWRYMNYLLYNIYAKKATFFFISVHFEPVLWNITSYHQRLDTILTKVIRLYHYRYGLWACAVE